MLMSVIGFLVILAPLVIVHEFGHFFFAKLFNVKAEVFSIGFGPRIFTKRFGETEFCLSAIPLGGFVKLLGEEAGTDVSPADAKRSLPRQAPWKRFFIFFGGPLFNFVYAALVFMAIVAIGEPQISNTVGRVLPNSEAFQVGIRSGDRITSVNGVAIRKFSEITQHIASHPGKQIQLGIERIQESKTVNLLLSVTPTSEKGFSPYGEETQVGRLDGMLPFARSLKIGVSNPNSVAGRAGLKTGDAVTTWNGMALSNWEQLEAAFRNASPGKPITLGIEGRDSVSLTLPSKGNSGPGEAWGIFSTELFVEKVVQDSPASQAGLAPLDRLIHVSGKKLASFFELKERIQSLGEQKQPIVIGWERDGKTLEKAVTPSETHGKDVLLNKTVTFTVGIVPLLSHAKPETVIERITSPVAIVVEGVHRMLTFTWRNLVSIGKMVVGDVSVKSLGGPILIGKLAGDSLERGLIEFLTTMAILSVGLGILNILPIPVLDGGHLLLLGIEVVRKRPLTLRQMEIVQQVGLSIILLLMVVVFRNDIMRL